jgi:GT2 family glycosyltransferase
MRVLAHIHTFNDADIIDQTIAAVLGQTRPVDGILIVDNASTDGTLDRASVKNTSVLQHPENRGTSGAVYSGFRVALEQDYDWIWVFDADSVPEPDALEKLLDLYNGWPQNLQDATAFLACLHSNIQDGVPRHGGLFTDAGIGEASPTPEARHYPCHFTIWSGCLYRVEAVRRIGLPNQNYVLDWGEGEYGYRVMRAGYKGFIDQDALLHHNIRGSLSFTPVKVRAGPLAITLFEFSPIRLYYQSRNMVYFVLYDIARMQPGLVLRTILGVARQTAGFLLVPRSHRKHLLACVRGLWHGVTGNIAARY